MILDTSAVFAVLLKEDGHAAFLDRMSDASHLLMSAGSWVELTAVAVRGRKIPPAALDKAAAELGVQVVPVTLEHAELARAAYRTYGRGTGHPASLNFGDCFAYALDKSTGEPLLFKGDDFAATDIVSAVPTGRAAS
ncbi:type II toxin-antitoxin system VapC family toxin [Sphingomonas lenta]|uniref:Ribonuclease VapC n=1 Tax=Sphingomonas lenta TaxID=1141887 RepID=A0A2A2SHH6_9SPHN|nr:type II toxin-antitoxin system VapC family toxin [Sphingomonas lenta]PAX08717.1 VapC toxin family PIN domain ribonuclease [Sphingomonas lenta]